MAQPSPKTFLNRKEISLSNALLMSHQIVTEIQEWEESKQRFIQRIKPLMETKIREFQKLFESYIYDTKLILQSEKFGDDIQSAIVKEYQEKYSHAKLMFDFNHTIQILEKEIKARKLLANTGSSVVKIQAFWRGCRARKQTQNQFKDIRRRTAIVNEILQTEKAYVKSLNAMVNVFLKPMQDKAFTASKIISNSEIIQIFSNVETILGVNIKLLNELESRILNCPPGKVKIGDIFKDLAPFFKLYTKYVESYASGEKLIVELIEKNPQFSNFLNERACHPDVLGKSGLQNCRIMPIQRIPRYVLLLTDLLKHTPENHVDYEDLKNALKSFSELAIKINTSKGMSDNINKVWEIQEKLGLEELVQPSRIYIKEGSLLQEKKIDKHLHSKNSLRATVTNLWSKVAFSHTSVKVYLFNDLLLVANASIADAYFSRETLHCLELKEATIEPIDSPKYKGFSLTLNKGRSTEDIWLFYGENESELNQWIEDISKCITEIKTNYKTLKIDSRIKMPRINGSLETLSNYMTPTTPFNPKDKKSQSKGPPAFGIKLPSLTNDSPTNPRNLQKSTNIDSTTTTIDLLHSNQKINPPSSHSTPNNPYSTPNNPYSNNQNQNFQNQNQNQNFQNQNQNQNFQNQNQKSIELGEAIKSYKRIFELENQIFSTLPQIKQIIQNYPQLSVTMPTLNELISQITNEHSKALLLLKDERNLTRLTIEIYKGQDHLKNLSTTVGLVFPKGSTIPGSQEIRNWTAYLMQWYFGLVELLDEIEKQKKN